MIGMKSFEKNIFFLRWGNKIFWVAAILVGRLERGNKRYFILGLIRHFCLLYRLIGHFCLREFPDTYLIHYIASMDTSVYTSFQTLTWSTISPHWTLLFTRVPGQPTVQVRTLDTLDLLRVVVVWVIADHARVFRVWLGTLFGLWLDEISLHCDFIRVCSVCACGGEE
jgi:hypothetical protein